MAVLMELSIFSISGEISKKKEVVKILQEFKANNIDFELSAMGTSIECKDMQEALRILKIATDCMDCKRYYVIAKFDCYDGRDNMLATRTKSVLQEI
ncbi:hypothetical protein CQA57_02760 [Helicobacter anseris]|uniref:Thiamine-binding protein domain-containing protein n=1 Tax=Helicobacter anseris TaxID=375926 RepID=A0A3D8JAV8_9HELI|nr:thiamine-binding protein [Helicobacter anseris]RDU74206.1 hypothetical protein CQA57_02760 [Helicobacter anseris]